MKNKLKMWATGIIMMVIVAGCSSSAGNKNLTLEEKHLPFPDYIVNSPQKVQDTYILASNYPKALAVSPCYCGCGSADGHKSVLDCFVDGIGPDGEVTGWDQMGIACDICVEIANEAADMYQEGKELKDIQNQIIKTYSKFGESTPTPEIE